MKIEKISSTSAFVILLTMGEIHTSKIAKKFLDMLNLHSGKHLLTKSNQFWPHYSEVIKNRKSCILDLANNTILENKIEQVIIFGAGFDALSLEISSRFRNCKLFEIDIANMNTKSNLIDSIDSSLTDYIQCIAMDISNIHRIIPNLVKHGWNKDVSSLVIFKGISYYLSTDILWMIMGKFKTTNHSNEIILEYLLPNKKILNKHVPMAEYLFNLIAVEASLTNITKYDIDDIGIQVKKLDGIVHQHYDMKKMEQDRTSKNIIFKTSQSGWIEVCEFSV